MPHLVVAHVLRVRGDAQVVVHVEVRAAVEVVTPLRDGEGAQHVRDRMLAPDHAVRVDQVEAGVSLEQEVRNAVVWTGVTGIG